MILLNDMRKDIPLSNSMNTPSWRDSSLYKLTQETDRQCYLQKEPHYYEKPPGCWRVVHAFWHPDDETMTRFMAYDLNGALTFAAFGVYYDSLPQDRWDVDGYYKFPPPHVSYLLSVDGKFMTPNTGGYSVSILDQDYPSETFHFGMSIDGRQHKCLVIGFRLFMSE